MSGSLYYGSPPEKFYIFQFYKFSKFDKYAILDFENEKNAIFSGLVKNYCCYNGKTGTTQLSTILFSGNRP